ncbi:MAG TPA: hypothetical protein VHS97_07700, partial [Isosphaeraceae bacterium]|nr:hypothetical protein [Isosphaeraceae bacterium]
MSRTELLSRGAGFLMLGGVLLSGVSAFGADEPPLSNQLTELGRQALAQGSSKAAKNFFEKALTLDPSNPAATRGLKDAESAERGVIKVAFQDEPKPDQPPAGQDAKPDQPPAGAAPATPPPPAPATDRATIEQSEAAENIARQ